MRIKLSFENCFSVDRLGRSGGLAIFWKHYADCGITSYFQNHKDIEFNKNNIASWHLMCFYGFPERARRKESWDMIRSLSKMSTIQWYIMIDFNNLLYNADKRGVHPHPLSLMEGFGKAVECSFLTETDLSGGLFTW